MKFKHISSLDNFYRLKLNLLIVITNRTVKEMLQKRGPQIAPPRFFKKVVYIESIASTRLSSLDGGNVFNLHVTPMGFILLKLNMYRCRIIDR